MHSFVKVMWDWYDVFIKTLTQTSWLLLNMINTSLKNTYTLTIELTSPVDLSNFTTTLNQSDVCDWSQFWIISKDPGTVMVPLSPLNAVRVPLPSKKHCWMWQPITLFLTMQLSLGSHVMFMVRTIPEAWQMCTLWQLSVIMESPTCIWRKIPVMLKRVVSCYIYIYDDQGKCWSSCSKYCNIQI